MALAALAKVAIYMGHCLRMCVCGGGKQNKLKSSHKRAMAPGDTRAYDYCECETSGDSHKRLYEYTLRSQLSNERIHPFPPRNAPFQKFRK